MQLVEALLKEQNQILDKLISIADHHPQRNVLASRVYRLEELLDKTYKFMAEVEAVAVVSGKVPESPGTVNPSQEKAVDAPNFIDGEI